MTEESETMNEIHRIREEFYLETKGKSPEYILKLIKEASGRVKRQLEKINPDPKLLSQKRESIPQSNSQKTIPHIRERKQRYGK